jgi:cytochrome c oxidase cbb3-type subunit III
MKKFFMALSLFFGINAQALSQTANEVKATSFLNDPMLIFYIVVAFIFVIALLVLVVAAYMLQVLNIMVRQAEQEKAARLGIELKPVPSVWKKLWERSNALQPLEKESDILLDHNYDGIRELDNHLPPWWKWLFYATIGFSAVYLMVFHVFDSLPSQLQEYDNEVAYANEQLLKFKSSSPVAAIDENTVEATTDALDLADGKLTFLNTCASCHRKDGGGDIGPNLTDEYWLHGGSMKDLFKVVKHGVQGTNMIAWEGVISHEKMRNVSSYILTLQGSNPANAKKPQGEISKPDQKEVKTDSVKTQASL